MQSNFITEIKENKKTDALERRTTVAEIKAKTNVVIYDLRDARILLSKTILQVQQDKIKDSKARSIAYLTSIYVACYRDSFLEQRILALEHELNIDIT